MYHCSLPFKAIILGKSTEASHTIYGKTFTIRVKNGYSWEKVHVTHLWTHIANQQGDRL